MKALRFLAALAAIAAIWQAGALLLGERILPSPGAVAVNFLHEIKGREFWQHTGASASRAAGGIFCGFAAAFPLGVWLGLSRRLDAWLSPVIFLTYPIPKVLFLPVLLVLLGLGEAPKILLVALTVGYQILVVTRDSVRAVDRNFIDSFTTLLPAGRKLSSFGGLLSLARHVAVPAALPAAATALRIASGTAVAVLFMAESFVTDRGLGFMIMDAWGALDLPRMFTGITAMGLLGLILHEICDRLEHRFSRWTGSD